MYHTGCNPCEQCSTKAHIRFTQQSENLVEELGSDDVTTAITGRGLVRVPAADSATFVFKVPRTFPYDLVLRYWVTYSEILVHNA